jgi:hypothetical protein
MKKRRFKPGKQAQVSNFGVIFVNWLLICGENEKDSDPDSVFCFMLGMDSPLRCLWAG